ncbi:MAG: CRISPR-associated protein Cas4 [Candidatus Hydrogenedentota bacterium]|jgi:CRISPR-associated exonuclease Cas4|uniref:CRISPR-associated exonuclease Cas4 n=1 Tax=Sumerlaea chitinivorans TaxID=2250252 RepID=A0A2Z4Y8W8_SUMC1|nr:CRISPR-associated RecB family exonuclease Cas4 [Candidatus Sumerlaea chitinivorans]MCX7964783.1 CRISPR-associated protein Cas4 [Candidatus Sumerlaea chitinivorans]RMH23929.1 MAG: CRISPR-associated protein Cas4 [Candidatus Hydrogenedentota bacterium]
MSWDEELVPIASLQHYIFCPRQCALMYVEQQWEENLLTVEGRLLHEKADSGATEERGGVRIARALPLRSERYGLVGKADVVEFIPAPSPSMGKSLSNCEGFWVVHPVEYKHGTYKPDLSDHIQLCAQALCLEEMLSCEITQGCIYYARPRRRQVVMFHEDLRRATIECIANVRQLLESATTPAPVYTSKCHQCSLVELCMPQLDPLRMRSKTYLEEMRREALRNPPFSEHL